MSLRHITDAELEAVAERAAKAAATEVLRKLGCPDGEQDPAGAVQWAADVQAGVGAVRMAREGVAGAVKDMGRWVWRGVMFLLTLGAAVLILRATPFETAILGQLTENGQ